MIRTEVLEYDAYEAPWAKPLADFIAEFQAALEAIPTPFRASATVQANERGYDESSWDLKVWWERWETDDELDRRVRAERQKQERNVTEREARERQTLAALKAKYEPK